ALAATASATPAVAAALRTGGATREDLLAVEGGPDFVAQLDAFLAEHGHLGQANDDFLLASWVEEPGAYLDELAKRIGRPAVSATRRRERLRAEADARADSVRERLSGQPDELAAFERLLALARDIGPLTEGHNYWIDRMAQSRLRQLATRVGRRLAAEGTIGTPDDVFFLEHRDITTALATPSDLKSLVAERRAAFAQQRAIRPPAVVGKPPEATTTVDRFEGARIESDVADELRGTGASGGIVRGPARVALSPADFGRIQPGDIIVCPSSNPSWVPVFVIAGGLVTNTGGVLSHAAVVAREFGLPAVVGIAGATDQIADGREVEIDGTRGIVRML
ncbi:MAG TPA: PEP-utilizing enzyme, partial [Candidatus Limnocylindrales bacterium]